jgi:hypothetical protein
MVVMSGREMLVIFVILEGENTARKMWENYKII